MTVYLDVEALEVEYENVLLGRVAGLLHQQ